GRDGEYSEPREAGRTVDTRRCPLAGRGARVDPGRIAVTTEEQVVAADSAGGSAGVSAYREVSRPTRRQLRPGGGDPILSEEGGRKAGAAANEIPGQRIDRRAIAHDVDVGIAKATAHEELTAVPVRLGCRSTFRPSHVDVSVPFVEGRARPSR